MRRAKEYTHRRANVKPRPPPRLPRFPRRALCRQTADGSAVVAAGDGLAGRAPHHGQRKRRCTPRDGPPSIAHLRLLLSPGHPPSAGRHRAKTPPPPPSRRGRRRGRHRASRHGDTRVALRPPMISPAATGSSPGATTCTGGRALSFRRMPAGPSPFAARAPTSALTRTPGSYAAGRPVEPPAGAAPRPPRVEAVLGEAGLGGAPAKREPPAERPGHTPLRLQQRRDECPLLPESRPSGTDGYR